MKDTRLTKDVPLSPGQLKLLVQALALTASELALNNEWNRDQITLAKYLKTFLEETK